MYRKPFLVFLLLVGLMAAAACGDSKETPEPTASAPVESPTTTPEEGVVAEEEASPAGLPAQEAAEEPPKADEAPAEAAPTEAPTEESSDAPAETPVIRVGVNAEFEPFVFVDENGNLAGFDIDIMNALSAAAGFEFTYVTTPFEGIFEGLENDEFDAAISAITITDARRERVDFTSPYFEPGMAPVSYFSAGQGIATLADNMAIMGQDDLTGNVTVGVKKGTTGADFAAGETEAKIVEFDEAVPAMQALVNAEVTAVVLDTPVIIDFIKTNPGAAIKLVGGPVTDEQYGIAVAKERPLVLDGLNRAIAEIQESGAYDQIFQKWFGTP